MSRLSSRGVPLVYQGTPKDRPVLTLENYSKWYNFYLVKSDGSVIEEPTPWEESPVSPPFLDHCPHPDTYVWLCQEKGYILHTETLEMIVGRWMMEYVGPHFLVAGCLLRPIDIKCLTSLPEGVDSL